MCYIGTQVWYLPAKKPAFLISRFSLPVVNFTARLVFRPCRCRFELGRRGKWWFSQFLYKTTNISQKLFSMAQGPKVSWKPKKPKHQNTTKSKKHGPRCPLKWSPKCPSTKSKTCLGVIQDTQPSPTKKCFVPNVNVLDFVEDIFGCMNKSCVFSIVDPSSPILPQKNHGLARFRRDAASNSPLKFMDMSLVHGKIYRKLWHLMEKHGVQSNEHVICIVPPCQTPARQDPKSPKINRSKTELLGIEFQGRDCSQQSWTPKAFRSTNL